MLGKSVLSCNLEQGWQTFSVEGQVVNIFSFAGHTVSRYSLLFYFSQPLRKCNHRSSSQAM